MKFFFKIIFFLIIFTAKSFGFNKENIKEFPISCTGNVITEEFGKVIKSELFYEELILDTYNFHNRIDVISIRMIDSNAPHHRDSVYSSYDKNLDYYNNYQVLIMKSKDYKYKSIKRINSKIRLSLLDNTYIGNFRYKGDNGFDRKIKIEAICSGVDELNIYKQENIAKIGTPKNDDEKVSGASGTAFFINNNGYMITNHHVIDECNDNSKIRYKNKNIKAKLIAKDKFLDLALLKADVKDNNFIKISTTPPKKLRNIIVAGYPFGLELSNDLKFNSGIITSLKGLGDDSTRIQIDAAINPGNSGGPVVFEENGKLVAVAVAGLSKDKSEAINFGIKASSVKNFLESNQIDLKINKKKIKLNSSDLVELLESSTLYTFCE
tara:strand:+ start:521 stop:1660 length:1140 start_codon:yes stop_codon:yes gene_type:complete